MLALLLRRVLLAVPMVLGVATLVFVVLELAPGDATARYAAPGVAPEALEQMRRNMGLDRPAGERYLRWMGSMIRGDFGVSLARGEPVRDVVAGTLPNTLLLSGTALILAFGAGILLGTLQAVGSGGVVDRVISFTTLFFYSMPSFWLALMLILVFSVQARNVWDWPLWFPASGMVSVDHAAMNPLEQVVDRIRHLILPAISLTLVLAAGIARYMRASLLEVLSQDWVRTARAKGLPEWRVVTGHGLRNAMGPVATLFGLYLPVLFSGTVVIETVFAWPGMGKLMVDSIFQRDTPVVLAAAFLFALLVIVGNLVADILHALLDPRIRSGKGAA